jgi:hypothetical protein
MVLSQVRTKQGKGVYKGLPSDALQDRLLQEIPHTFGKALLHICEMDLPFSIIKFPRSAQDVDYCWDTLVEALGETKLPLRVAFDEAWERVVKPELIRFGG